MIFENSYVCVCEQAVYGCAVCTTMNFRCHTLRHIYIRLICFFVILQWIRFCTQTLDRDFKWNLLDILYEIIQCVSLFTTSIHKSAMNFAFSSSFQQRRRRRRHTNEILFSFNWLLAERKNKDEHRLHIFFLLLLHPICWNFRLGELLKWTNSKLTHFLCCYFFSTVLRAQEFCKINVISTGDFFFCKWNIPNEDCSLLFFPICLFFFAFFIIAFLSKFFSSCLKISIKDCCYSWFFAVEMKTK